MTGACGTISALLLSDLRERYDLVLLDIKVTDREGNPIEGVITVDLVDRDRDKYRLFFRGADAVIHNGFVGSVNSTNPFEAELNNIQMAYNIYQVAWEEGVRRVVMTSSNHAVDYYENLILDHKMDFVTSDMQSRSYAYYGWAKDSYEHLGFVFAVGRVTGRSLQNIQIRIGGPRETDLDQIEKGDLRRMRRALAVYISKRDLFQLYVKSIETEDISDENGIPFQIFYGISANTHAFWSIANARKVIGYIPQDNSAIRFHDKVGELQKAAQTSEK